MSRKFFLIVLVFIQIYTAKADELTQQEKNSVVVFVSDIKDKSYSIDGEPQFIETLNNYRRWGVSTIRPAKRLPSGNCIYSSITYFIGNTEGVLEHEGDVAEKILSLSKHEKCPQYYHDLDFVGADAEFSDAEILKLFNFISKLLGQSKNSCLKKFKCEDGLVSKLNSISLNNLLEIGKDKKWVTYHFMLKPSSTVDFLPTLLLRVDMKNKMIASSEGFVELDRR